MRKDSFTPSRRSRRGRQKEMWRGGKPGGMGWGGGSQTLTHSHAGLSGPLPFLPPAQITAASRPALLAAPQQIFPVFLNTAAFVSRVT